MESLKPKFDVDVAFEDPVEYLLKCPICGFDCVHLKKVVSSKIDPNRSEVGCELTFTCESSHVFTYRFGHHKGYTIVTLEGEYNENVNQESSNS